jgi:hypothetical protein
MRYTQAFTKLVGKRPSPAMVVALVALFISLTGNGLALSGKFTVDGNDLQRGAVHRYAIHKGAVSSAQLGGDAVHDSNLAKIIVVTNTVSIPPSNQDQLSAQCPEGTQLISGGAGSSTFANSPIESRPNLAPDPDHPHPMPIAWLGGLRNNSASAVDLRVQAVCLK